MLSQNMPQSRMALFCLLLCLILLTKPFAFADDAGQQANDDGTGNAQNVQQDGQDEDFTDLSISSLMNSVSDKGKQDFDAIHNAAPNLTKMELNNRLDAWALNQSDTFNTFYTALKTAFVQARTELDQRHMQIMANFTLPDANMTAEIKEADQRLRAISNNQFINPIEEQAEINAEFAKHNATVNDWLTKLAPYPAQQ